MIKRNKIKGFTLVELLAVIVILAIILVIAVPQIMDTIKDTTKASFESSAKMVAAQVENQYTVAQTLSKEFGSKGSCMQDWAGLNNTDYEDCTYEITSDGTAKITLIGKGKFKDLKVVNGTRSNATAEEGTGPTETSAECFTFDEETGTITEYDIECGTDVVIPSKINNVEVINIGSGSFSELGITSVVLPNTVENIEEQAFYDNNISEVEISSSVKKVAIRAFYSNPLSKVTLHSNDVEIVCEAFGKPSTIATHNLPDSYVNNPLCPNE